MTKNRTTRRTNPTLLTAADREFVQTAFTAVRTAYTGNADKIAALLTDLDIRLKTHRARFDAVLAAGRTDWGYPGDLGHVATVLTEITEFLPKE